MIGMPGMSEKEKEVGIGLVVVWLIVTWALIVFLSWPAAISISLLLAVLFSDCLFRVSTITAAVVNRISRRTGRVLREGFHLGWPLGIDNMETVALDLQTTPFTILVFSKDDLGIQIEGSLQWRAADPDHKRSDGKPLLFTYLETEDAKIKAGLIDTVKDALGRIAGLQKGEVFISQRETLAIIIDSALRLKTPPHLMDDNKDLLPWKPSLKSADTVEVKDKYRLKFYAQRRGVISRLLETEADRQDETSSVEAHYGIDILVVALASVDFTPEVKAAMQKKREEEAKKIAARETIKQKNETMEALSDRGLTVQMVNDASDVAAGLAKPREIKTVAVEGLTNLINIGK